MSPQSSTYRVELTARAPKQLKKMDRFDAKILATWIKNNLDGCADPRAFGKGLTANRAGEWRYRVGSYRILITLNLTHVQYPFSSMHVSTPLRFGSDSDERYSSKSSSIGSVSRDSWSQT
ncbi:type II toxin-antitoxin system RelE family toxin [Corynebacterium riegelii]|uniref:type II toxin-antitoxin system RelE family toxin n=1 Tax=Corynebacterium riegelii TaxID=156976 RepID=UPI00191D889A|nr:type II toxin-antitoxin system RelE/ParE family toxin [Corynebacterium riegelii]QQU83233.1 type II toxin-antitoxin system RelE/ParE family toxin [Corynebacterium riegelii]